MGHERIRFSHGDKLDLGLNTEILCTLFDIVKWGIGRIASRYMCTSNDEVASFTFAQ